MKILLALLTGILLFLSFPTADLSFLAWVALAPLLLAVRREPPQRAFGLGYLAGGVFFFALLFWLRHVSYIGYVSLSAYCALYLPAFALLFRMFERKGYPMLFLGPLLWVGLEYLRTVLITGFPWELLGNSQYRFYPLLQAASLGGVYAVSFLVALVNTAVYLAMRDRRSLKALIPLGAAFGLVFLSWGWGRRRIEKGALTDPAGAVERLKVAVVQGNIPQEIKWEVESADTIMEKFDRLTAEAALGEPDLIVWPESSVPRPFLHDADVNALVKRASGGTGAHLLFGSNRPGDPEGKTWYNAAYLVSPQGEVLGCYDKLHLVIFGEYVPLQAFFPFLKKATPIAGGFTPGAEFSLLPCGKTEIATLICFEDILPGLVARFVRRGANLLVNVTNDAWFKKSAAPYQHATIAAFRCVENGLYMVRAANTGLSCFIDPYGRIFQKVSDGKGNDIFVLGSARAEVLSRRADTLFSRGGFLFAPLCLVLSAAVLLHSFLRP